MTGHPLTLDMLEEGHLLIIGQTRSGKTYQLRGAIEQLRRADRRVGAIDKLGNHWGLTLSADGKQPGLEFVIFGGKRAHVPMTPGQGAELGKLFVSRNIPAIFDVSQWTAEDQRLWVAGFTDAVFRHNEGPLHLAMDEAQSWVPLNGGGEAFGNVLRIAEQGLGNGIRLMLTVQRLSRLDATVRSMAHIVVAMRQTGTVDRRAVADLIASTPEEAAAIRNALPNFAAGTGYLWDPASAQLRQISFPANTSFDSSRTPRHGDTIPPPVSVSSDLVAELRAALAPQPEAAETGQSGNREIGKSGNPDQAALLKQRDDLASSLAIANGLLRQSEAALQRTERECDRYQDGLALLEELVDAIANGNAFSGSLSSGLPRLGAVIMPLRVDERPPVPRPAEPPAPPPPARGRKASALAPGAPDPLNRTAQEAAALLRGQGEAMIWNDVLLQIGRRPNSGDSRKARKALVDHGLVENAGDAVDPLEALFESADFGIGHWRGPDELVGLWAEKLRGPGGDILRCLFEQGEASSAIVAERLGRSPTSGWWRKGLKDLKGSRIVTMAGNVLFLHPFFLDEEEPGP